MNFPCPVCSARIDTKVHENVAGIDEVVCPGCETAISAILASDKSVSEAPKSITSREWELFIADACASFVGRICGTPGWKMPREVTEATYNILLMVKEHERWLRLREQARANPNPEMGPPSLRVIEGGATSPDKSSR